MLKLFSRSRFSRRPTAMAIDGCSGRRSFTLLRRSTCRSADRIGPDRPDETPGRTSEPAGQYVMVDNFS